MTSTTAHAELGRTAVRRAMAGAPAVLLGAAVSLVLCGYQFGTGNHTVYLIAPLRQIDPALLRNDWWTTHTLQYHWAFTELSAGLMRAGIIQPVFLGLYLALAIWLHAGWLRGARAMGLDERGYVLSVLLYYLSAGGLGLGSYRFLQDGSFLPGNLANAAMLWGIVYWMEQKERRGAIALATAALFHLNHALVGLGMCATVALIRLRRHEKTESGRAALAMAAVLLAGLANTLPAARRVFSGGVKMPLGEFVDVYVHLRHPHHYDPMSWPPAVWIAFLWMLPFAVSAWRRRTGDQAWRRAGLAFAFFMTLQAAALVFAGVFFVSESLIQMSLFRFSIYPKLLACIAAAAWMIGLGAKRPKMFAAALAALPALLLAGYFAARATAPTAVGDFVLANRLTVLLFIGLTMAMAWTAAGTGAWSRSVAMTAVLAVAFAGWRGKLGLRLSLTDDEDADYAAVCDWARVNTPVDAIFLVPPNEQLFRFRARRAIVVNFKNVPQLSGEMEEWKQRLETVLDEPLTTLPRRYDLAHAAIARRYDVESFEHLARAARRYGARYLVTTRNINGRLAVFEAGRYHLYDLNLR